MRREEERRGEERRGEERRGEERRGEERRGEERRGEERRGEERRGEERRGDALYYFTLLSRSRNVLFFCKAWLKLTISMLTKGVVGDTHFTSMSIKPPTKELFERYRSVTGNGSTGEVS